MDDIENLKRLLAEREERAQSRDTKEYFYMFSAVCIFIICTLFYAFFWSAPKNFPVNSLYDLSYGATLSQTAENLHAEGITRSEFWLKSFVRIFSLGHTDLVAGEYNLYKDQNVIAVAWRITHGNLDIVPIKITIPEGLNLTEIAAIFSKDLPDFDVTNFVALVKSENLEGYIFPDTYFFVPGMTNQEIIQTMNNNFNEKIQTVLPQIQAFGKSESDVIKMASILEDEAQTNADQRIIAGILWKRIALGIPLEVDSSFRYILATSTQDLTPADLQIDSPYNSYMHTGLPPTPISNPGLASIINAITPTVTPYLYFLSDSEGNMHYAATLAEQDANEAKYLKR